MREVSIKHNHGQWRAFIRTEAGEFELRIPWPPDDDGMMPSWVNVLDDEQLEALLQIFYDRWNWDTGSKRDKNIWMLLDNEKNRRKRNREENVYDPDEVVLKYQDNYEGHV